MICNIKPFLAAAHGLMIRRMAVGSTELSVQCARHAACEDLMSATCSLYESAHLLERNV